MEEYKLFKSADELDDQVLMNMIERKVNAARGFWQTNFNLDSVREDNLKYYLGTYQDEELEDPDTDRRYYDPRIFSAIRTQLPFVTARITQPEVYPSSNKRRSVVFASEFEMALKGHAEKVYSREKVRLAAQDNLKGERVGLLKWRYDILKDDILLEHVDPRRVVISPDAKLYEEPPFLQEEVDMTVEQICKMFPEKEEKLFRALSIEKGTLSQLEKQLPVKETWMYLPDENYEPYLYVCYSWNKIMLGKDEDPNWRKGKPNVLDHQMIPYMFINFLNDGKHLIDHTSFIEQAKYLQRTQDKRGSTIAQNAEYGGIGVPVFGSDAITQTDAAKVKFSPEQRIILSQQVQGNFDVWRAGDMPNFVIEDKFDARNEIDNTFGTPNIFRGEQSNNNTATQDVLIRNQAENRQQELIDAIDAMMERFYQLLAQLMYRYFDSEHYYPYIGENGDFAVAMVKQTDIDTGISIRVKAGTSLPIDREQQRAAIMELAKLNLVDPYTLYKLYGFDDPEIMTDRLLMYSSAPDKYLQDIRGEETSREAEVDLKIALSGKTPEEREDIDPAYIEHLNKFLLTSEYEQLSDAKQVLVSDFIKLRMSQAQKKLDKLQNQLPNPQDVIQFNQAQATQEQSLAPQQGQPAPQPPAQY